MDASVLIVGAGPYGLGIAQELWHRGVETAVVGEPFELWFRHTPAGMLLRSDANSSEIHSADGRYGVRRFFAGLSPGSEAGSRRARLEIEGFRLYLADVLRRLPFAIERSAVVHLEPAGGGFAARLDDGRTLRAGAAVLATGIGPHRHLPEALRRLPAERVAHTWEVERLAAISGGRVLIVGGGQSAAEAAAALRGGNEVLWALRRKPIFFTEPINLPTPIFKLVLALSPRFYDLPAGARRALSRLFFHATITPSLREVYADPRVRKVFAGAEELALFAEAGGLRSPRVGPVDMVVAATGYRCSLAGLSFLAAGLRERLASAGAVPPLDRSFQTRVPGLFLAGGIAEAAFGPAQRFILGSRHAARRIGRALVPCFR